MNTGYYASIRHYTAPLLSRDDEGGTWYGEYDGIFTVREFVVWAHSVTVAPFDFAFRGPGHPTEPPNLPGVTSVSLAEFETLWERLAQARLRELAALHTRETLDGVIWYFRAPFPAELKCGEPSSSIHYEFAGDVGRRSFEVFPNRTEVSPYDAGTPEVSAQGMLKAAREGRDPEGEPIDPQVRPQLISHSEFESLWELHALPRLQVLAGISSG